MTIEYIRYKVAENERDTFVKSYATASTQLDVSPYCKGYELTECEEEKGSFILRIEWTSTEDHLNGFRKSEFFPEFFANIKPFLSNIQEMRHYSVTKVAKQK